MLGREAGGGYYRNNTVCPHTISRDLNDFVSCSLVKRRQRHYDGQLNDRRNMATFSHEALSIESVCHTLRDELVALVFVVVFSIVVVVVAAVIVVNASCCRCR